MSGWFWFAFAGGDLYLVLATARKGLEGQVEAVLASVEVGGRKMPGGGAGALSKP